MCGFALCVVGPHTAYTIAAFELFKRANPGYDFLAVDGIAPIDMEFELAQGAIDGSFGAIGTSVKFSCGKGHGDHELLRCR